MICVKLMCIFRTLQTWLCSGLCYQALSMYISLWILYCLGPDMWPLEYPQCSGARQSPINLESDDMYRLVLPEQLRWHGYWDQPRNLTLTNNGHTSWFLLFYYAENVFLSQRWSFVWNKYVCSFSSTVGQLGTGAIYNRWAPRGWIRFFSTTFPLGHQR